MNYFVYILAPKKDGVLYIGVTTNNLKRRVREHKQGLLEGSTHKYFVKTLVYYELSTDVQAAIQREKQLKKWKRDWKIKLIEKTNKNREDLYDDIQD